MAAQKNKPMQVPTLNCQVKILHTRDGVREIASRHIRTSMEIRRIIPRSDSIRNRMMSTWYTTQEKQDGSNKVNANSIEDKKHHCRRRIAKMDAERKQIIHQGQSGNNLLGGKATKDKCTNATKEEVCQSSLEFISIG